MRRSRPYEERLHASFDHTLREASDFFMGTGDVRKTLRSLAKRLDARRIGYAVVGGMALGEHGYVRMTEDIDIVLTREGLERFQQEYLGRGYVPAYAGARRSFRDTETQVRIKVLVTGEYPGDGKPKAVAFPNPLACSTKVRGIRVLDLPRVVELKLASGMTAPHRLRDLADVQELMKTRKLDASFAQELDSSVRAKFLELLASVEAAD